MTYDEILIMLQQYCGDSDKLINGNFEDLIVKPLKLHTDLSFSWDMGVTKGVLIFPEFDKVIKIPFYGHFLTDEFEEALEDWENAVEDAVEPVEDDYIEEFVYAKLPAEEKDFGNYCALETELYKRAKQEHLEQYFAAEQILGSTKSFEVYIQDKADPFNDDNEDEAKTTSTTKRCKELRVYCFNAAWITDFFEWYGEEEFLRLSSFLQRYKITDLHAGNLGYIHGAPVIFDYSSYREY